jgi:hypothetical protein
MIFLIKLSGMISLLANTSNKELRSILELLRFLGLEVSKFHLSTDWYRVTKVIG